MNDYFLVRFRLNPCTETECDILAALLCDAGFESFVADERGLSAYVNCAVFAVDSIPDVLSGYDFQADIDWKMERIPGEDWNVEWEKHYFRPIVISDRCVIHSSFHTDYPKAKYDIVIDPRMAFGTGHHETTSLMAERILDADMQGKSVLDMGTGTGILAILSAMCGAEHVVGIEIDPVAYENAVDNIRLNGQAQIELRCGGAETVVETSVFDYVFANINRNVILEDMSVYARTLRKGGSMVLSGFYEDDVTMICNRAGELSLHKVSVHLKNKWANVVLLKD